MTADSMLVPHPLLWQARGYPEAERRRLRNKLKAFRRARRRGQR